MSKPNNQPGSVLPQIDRPRDDWPPGTVQSPPPELAILFSKDAQRYTPKVVADAVNQTRERLVILRGLGLVSAWGVDADDPPVTHARVRTAKQGMCSVTGTQWTAARQGCSRIMVHCNLLRLVRHPKRLRVNTRTRLPIWPVAALMPYAIRVRLACCRPCSALFTFHTQRVLS